MALEPTFRFAALLLLDSAGGILTPVKNNIFMCVHEARITPCTSGGETTFTVKPSRRCHETDDPNNGSILPLFVGSRASRRQTYLTSRRAWYHVQERCLLFQFFR